MSEPILLGFGILVLMVVWHFIIRRTALDTFRDKLFDLRESLRQFYVENGYGLEHKTYGELRLLINNQIRFLEQASLTGLSVCRAEYQQNKDFRECLDDLMKNRFQTDDKKLADYIRKVRSDAYDHATGYVIFSSLGLTCVCFTLAPIALAVVLAHKSFAISKRVLNDAFYALIQKIFSRDLIEGVAILKQGKAIC